MAHDSIQTMPPFDLPSRAIRVTLSYQGQDLRLVSRRMLHMRTLPSDPLDVSQKQVGFWFQVEDANGRLLYRRTMHNPIRFDTETPSDDSERPLKRVPLGEPAGTFFLLVPFLREAKTVRVFSSPFEPGKDTDPAREIMHFNISDDITDGRPDTPPPSRRLP